MSCHAEGEVGDVIVGGVAPPPGATLWEQARWLDRDGERLIGLAWITGTHQLMLDPENPWPHGYRVADTWPLRR